MKKKLFLIVPVLIFLFLLAACMTTAARGTKEVGENEVFYTYSVDVIAPKDIDGNPVIVDSLPMKKVDFSKMDPKMMLVYDINLDIHMGDGTEFSVIKGKKQVGKPVIVFLTVTESDLKRHKEPDMNVYFWDNSTGGEWVQVPREISVQKLIEINDKKKSSGNVEIYAIFDGLVARSGKRCIKLSIYGWPKDDRLIGHDG